MLPLVKRVLSVFKPFWKPLTLIALLTMAQKVGDLLVPFFGGRVIDALAQNRSLDAVHLLIATSFIFWVCHGNILPYVLGRIDLKKFRYPAPKHIGVRNIQTIVESPFLRRGQDTAMQQAIIERGEQVLMDFMNSFARVAIPISLPGVVTLGILLWCYPLIAVIVVVGGTLDLLVTLYLNKVLPPMCTRLQGLDFERQRLLTQIFRNLFLGTARGQEQGQIADYNERYGAFATFGITTGRRFLNFNFSRGLIINVTNLMTWIVGAWYVSTGVYSLGYFLASLSWASYVLNVVGAVTDLHRQWLETTPAIRAFFAEIDACGPAAPDAVAAEDPDGVLSPALGAD